MAIELTPTNKSLSKQIGINPQAILQIEGIETVFGAQPVLEFTRWDANSTRWDQVGLKWDALSEKPFSKAVIDLSQGTTNNITQQILPDKGGSSSVSTVNIQLVDLDNTIAPIFSFDRITEILGKKADFYIGYKQAAFPEDSIPVFRGVIVDFYTEDGIVMVSVAHPEALKRQTIYEQFQTELNGAIDSTQTNITVVDTNELIASQDAIETYIQIDDELMLVNSINSGTSLTVTRAREGTIGLAHDDDAETISVYKMTGKPTDLALKLMLSNDGNTYFNSDDLPVSINFISILETIQNAIVFDYYDIQEITGLVKGDFIKLTGVNAGTYTIQSFGIGDNGSYIIVNENLITETEYTGTLEYKSSYNVLPQGLQMLPNQVDVSGHQAILAQFPSNFVEYSFFLKETLDDAKEFIDKEIYFPQGLYQIPRKARSSVKLVTPPFASDIVPTINTENITNITRLRQRRSAHKYLYNIIRYDYNKDVIDENFLAKDILISTESLERIKVGRKQLKIESSGLRKNLDTTQALSQIASRVIDRYKFAPTYFENIEVKYSDGFALEVGDVLPFAGLDTKIVNLETGRRGVETELFEVINKSLNIKTGQIKLSLLSTGFSIDGRNAVVSPASGCGASSTTSRIEITRIVDTGEYVNESDKWVEFSGENIRVYKNDYTQDETVKLLGVDPGNNNFLLVSPALSFTPGTQHILGIPEYDNTAAENNSQYKLRFAHFTAKVNITSVTNAQIFNVDNASELLEGSKIVVSSLDYVDDSFGSEATIDNITGSTITLSDALSFTPLVGYKVERSNFLDSGSFYSII